MTAAVIFSGRLGATAVTVMAELPRSAIRASQVRSRRLHGITLSEAARLAPPEQVGAVSGGVLSFGQIGAGVPRGFFAAAQADRWLWRGLDGLRRAGNSGRRQHAARGQARAAA